MSFLCTRLFLEFISLRCWMHFICCEHRSGQIMHTDHPPHLFWIGGVALAHQMNARPSGINLMIYNCWNYKWTMNCNLSSLNVRMQQCIIMTTVAFSVAWQTTDKPSGYSTKPLTFRRVSFRRGLFSIFVETFVCELVFLIKLCEQFSGFYFLFW